MARRLFSFTLRAPRLHHVSVPKLGVLVPVVCDLSRGSRKWFLPASLFQPWKKGVQPGAQVRGCGCCAVCSSEGELMAKLELSFF